MAQNGNIQQLISNLSERIRTELKIELKPVHLHTFLLKYHYKPEIVLMKIKKHFADYHRKQNINTYTDWDFFSYLKIRIPKIVSNSNECVYCDLDGEKTMVVWISLTRFNLEGDFLNSD